MNRENKLKIRYDMVKVDVYYIGTVMFINIIICKKCNGMKLEYLQKCKRTFCRLGKEGSFMHKTCL